MTLTADTVARRCRTLMGADSDVPPLSLEDYLDAIPRLASLNDLPADTVVLVRGDLDAKPGPTIGDGDIRLRSMLDTLAHGRQRGWKQVLLGHIGRKPEGSLAAVARRLGELLNCQVPLLSDWLDESSLSIREGTLQAISSAAAGSLLMLENTRRYEMERLLWDADPADADRLADPLARVANEFATRVGTVYVNEAFSAGSLDTSTVILPLAMRRVALGTYAAEQFDGPLRRCLDTRLVVFSGLKADKLDDLEAMIDRGRIRWVIAAGSLAMALKKAWAELENEPFSMGVAEDPKHADKPYFVPRERVDQARGMIASGRERGMHFVLPRDFVLEDGRISETIGPADQQFDIGPLTSQYFAEQVGRFLEEASREHESAVAFYNGVFGMFEDPRFEDGTRRFIPQLKRMKDAGVEVYVGGGEGGAALERYGQDDWVTHCFTAGGTVLNALGSKAVPYLQALRWAAGK